MSTVGKASFVALAFLLGACSASAPSGLPGGTSALEVLRASAAAGQHLYVSDAAGHSVLRFAVHGGIPAQAPDAQITGFTTPRGVAVGPDRRLYVVDAGTKQLLIYSLDSLQRVAAVALNHVAGVGTVAVDPLGYVYVGWEDVCTSEGFYCGNADVLSPFAKGLHVVNTILFGGAGGGVSTAEVRGMAVNHAQLLGAELDIGPPNVYTHAPFVQSFYTIFCGGVNDSGVAWSSGNLITTDLGASRPPSPPQVVVITKIESGCPPNYSITSATTPLNTPRAVASGDGLIYVTSAFDETHGSALVFVFNPSLSGSQKPVALIAGKASQLKDPRGIAIGP